MIFYLEKSQVIFHFDTENQEFLNILLQVGTLWDLINYVTDVYIFIIFNRSGTNL